MKLTILYGLLLFLLCCLASSSAHGQQQFAGDDDADETGDFAEFEDFEEDNSAGKPVGIVPDAPKAAAAGSKAAGAAEQVPQTAADDGDFYADDEDDASDGLVQDEADEDSEFEHFKDDEEFEGFSRPEPAADASPASSKSSGSGQGEPKLTMAKVPMHFRTHWDSYWLELIMIAGLVAYFANYCVGRTKNTRLATRWLATHRQLLEDNFVLIGGTTDSDAGRPSVDSADADDGGRTVAFSKESESLYTLWCSGRTCCEGMLVELKMIKRQDLVALMADLMRPTQDQLHIKLEISKDSLEPFVFAVAAKRTASRLFKEMADLSKYCIQVSKPDEKYGVPAGFSVLSEIPEASAAVLDARIIAALNKYAPLIDYIHITDQFSGPVQQEDPSVLKQPEVRRMLMCGFNLPKAGRVESDDDEDATTPLLVLVFYLLERLRRFRMSKESKSKADKNRSRVEEEFLKSTSTARAEAAALRREEKRKQEKDKILAEEDPEKQRRWELKEQKRQAKKKAPRTKQLSIKAF